MTRSGRPQLRRWDQTHDVDGLDSNRDGIRLLKALAQTEPTKTLNWLSKTSLLEKAGVPCRFTTTQWDSNLQQTG